MPPRFVAAVTCPSCGTRFQTPVEQILDVRVDPSAKNRMISGAVNVASCPSCGAGGSLNIPFIYHDPEKEVALLYLPAEAGSNEVERQEAAGRLARQLMNSMPQEERKGYLLQPETFITMDSMVKRVLELEGISEEELSQSQAQQEILSAFLGAPEDEWSEVLAEHEDDLNEGFFSLLEYVMQLASQGGQAAVADTEKLEALHDYLVEETELGQVLSERADVVRGFAEDPSRDSLLEALVDAPDEDTVTILVQSGIPFIDYAFFQKLLQQVDEAEDPEEAERLRALRRKILDLRDEMVEESESVMRQRSLLLGKMMGSEDPRKMASSHLSELDEAFFTVLNAQLQEAEEEGDEDALAALQEVAQVVNQILEGNLPPEVALIRRLMVAPSEEQLKQQLQNNRKALTPRFFQFMEAVRQSALEEGQADSAEHIAQIQATAKKIAPKAATEAESAMREAEGQATPSQVVQPEGARKRPSGGPVLLERGDEDEEESSSERRTPSGLIIPGR